MTDKTYPYDETLPFVLVNRQTGEMMGRTVRKSTAENFAAGLTVEVIDTTPAPRVPEDARFITWFAGGSRYFAELDSDGSWYCRQDSQAEALEDLPGVTPETRFTVLEPRESPELMDEQMRDDAARWGDGDDE